MDDSKLEKEKINFLISYRILMFMLIICAASTTLSLILDEEYPGFNKIFDMIVLQMVLYTILVAVLLTCVIIFFRLCKLIDKSDFSLVFKGKGKKPKEIFYSTTAYFLGILFIGFSYSFIPSITTYEPNTTSRLEEKLKQITHDLIVLNDSGKFIEIETYYLSGPIKRNDIEFNVFVNDTIASQIAKEKRGEFIIKNLKPKELFDGSKKLIESEYLLTETEKNSTDFYWSGELSQKTTLCAEVNISGVDTNSGTVVPLEAKKYCSKEDSESKYIKKVAIHSKDIDIKKFDKFLIKIVSLDNSIENYTLSLKYSQIRFSNNTLQQVPVEKNDFFCIDGIHKANPDSPLKVNYTKLKNKRENQPIAGSCSR